jgi:hypothetical protein
MVPTGGVVAVWLWHWTSWHLLVVVKCSSLWPQYDPGFDSAPISYSKSGDVATLTTTRPLAHPEYPIVSGGPTYIVWALGNSPTFGSHSWQYVSHGATSRMSSHPVANYSYAVFIGCQCAV